MKCFNKYDFTAIDNQIQGSDLGYYIDYFLNVKQLDGLATSTLKGYRGYLYRFKNFIDKPVKYIAINDLRNYISYIQSLKELKKQQ